MRRFSIMGITIIIVLIAVLFLDKTMMHKERDLELSDHIYTYMKHKNNQEKVFYNAIALNENKSSNACVYFVAEVLRQNKISISNQTANTAQLISVLKEKGWKKDNNYRNLLPGDIAFTTDESGSKNGVPSHTYVFMGWVNEGSYDYAYICDNQAKDYDNNIYHIRNIKDSDKVNGVSKDAFSFFMSPK